MYKKILVLLIMSLLSLALSLMINNEVNKILVFFSMLLILGSLWLVMSKRKILNQIHQIAQDTRIDADHKVAIDLPMIETLVKNLQNRLQDVNARLEFESGQHQRLRQSFRELEERYNFMLGRSNDGYWEWDLKSNEIQFSPSWKAMFGFTEDDKFEHAEAWEMLIHADDLADVKKDFSALLMGQLKHSHSQSRFRCKDGSYCWVLTRVVAIQHASGAPYKLIGHCSNINDIKRLEEIMEYIVDGTYGLDGKAFFQSLVKHFAIALNVRLAFISECVDKPPTRLRTIACYIDGEFIDSEYDLAATPCDVVIKEGRTCFIPDRLCDDYPNLLPYGNVSYLGIPIFDSNKRVLGHLCFEDSKPMDDSILITSIYRIFVLRAGHAMEKMYREQSLVRH